MFYFTNDTKNGLNTGLLKILQLCMVSLELTHRDIHSLTWLFQGGCIY